MSTPCQDRREAQHQLLALCVSHFHNRALFSEGEDFNGKDHAIAHTLDTLDGLILEAAKRLVNADRAHVKHLNKLREEARQQVEGEE